MELRHYFLSAALIGAAILIVPSVYTLFSGEHEVYVPGTSTCAKCHQDTKQDMETSVHHVFFSCENCHSLNGASNNSHGSDLPECLDCHGNPLRLVTDSKGNTFISPLAEVFGENLTNAESHIPMVSGAGSNILMKGENEACVSCHSAYNYDITYKRPEYVEWDVSNFAGTWTISNLVIGQKKVVNEKSSNYSGRLHNNRLITEVNCVSCHDDIKTAVLSGGHSNEQWGRNHSYTNYNNMNSYCNSCHKPQTQDIIGFSPYPSNPFNLPIHSSMTISCMDCHGKSGNLFVAINGGIKTPPYNSSSMRNIETSIGSQPAFIQGYFCMACKNTGNPVPNNSLHFKLYTEPQVAIYVDGTQRYP